MKVVVLLEGSDGGGGFLFFDLSLPFPFSSHGLVLLRAYLDKGPILIRCSICQIKANLFSFMLVCLLELTPHGLIRAKLPLSFCWVHYQVCTVNFPQNMLSWHDQWCRVNDLFFSPIFVVIISSASPSNTFLRNDRSLPDSISLEASRTPSLRFGTRP